MMELFAYKEMARASNAVINAFKNEISTQSELGQAIDGFRTARDRVLSVKRPNEIRKNEKLIKVLSDCIEVQKKTEGIISQYFHELNKLLQVSINKIIQTERIEKFKITDILPNLDQDIIGMILELNLPLTWNFDRDLFVTTQENKFLIEIMKQKGQKRIIALSSQVSVTEDKGVLIIKQRSDIFKSLLEYGFYPPRQTFTLGVNETTHGDLKSQIHNTVEAMNVYSNTSNKYSKNWIENEIKNTVEIVTSSCVSSLKNKFKDKDVIIVSPGPSLKSDMSDLKSLREKFLMVAPLQSLPALSNENIHPDYLVCIDPEDFSKFIDLKNTQNSKGLIIAESCHPNVMKTQIPKYILFTSKQTLDLHHLVNGEIKSLFGASVSIIATDLARDLGARSITLLGQDLILSQDNYFGLPKNYNETKVLKNTILWKGQEVPKKLLMGKDGKLHVTRPDFFNFHHEFEYFSEHVNQEISLFNATSFGADIKGFENVSLPEVLLKIDQNSNLQKNIEEFKVQGKTRKISLSIDHLNLKVERIKKIKKISSKILKLCKNNFGKNFNEIDKLEKKSISLSKEEWILSLYLKPFLAVFINQAKSSNTLSGNQKLTIELHSNIVQVSAHLEKIIFEEIENLVLLLRKK